MSEQTTDQQNDDEQPPQRNDYMTYAEYEQALIAYWFKENVVEGPND